MNLLKKLNSPIKAIIFSMVLWSIAYIFHTHSYTIILKSNGIFILAIYVIAFILGATFLKVIERNKESLEVSHEGTYNKKWINTLIILSIIGLLTKGYDLIVNKNYLSYSGSSDFKSNYTGDSFNFISLISALLFPMALLLLLAYIDDKKSFEKKQKIAVWANFGGIILFSVAIGTRTQITFIAVAVLFIFFSKKLNLSKSKKIKIIAFISVFLIGFFFYSVTILSDRLQYQKKNTSDALIYLEKMHHVDLDDFIWNFLDNNVVSGEIIYATVSLRHYLIHGIYQFQLLVDVFDTDNIAYGQYQFNPIFKGLSLLGVSYRTIGNIENFVPESGVYSTFFGDVYIDFGIYGFIYMFFLGVISQMIFSRRNNKNYKLMYSIIYSIILHMFFINMISYAMGLYFIISFILGLYIVPKFIRGGIVVEKT